MDTIAIQFEIEISSDFLAGWDYFKKKNKWGYEQLYHISVEANNGCKVNYTYYPISYIGKPLLKVEFSIPHLIYGDNVYMVCDIPGALAKANELLPLPPGCPHIDLAEGTLRRLDVCYNFQVGKLAPYYIRALQQRTYPYRTTKAYLGNGVMYENGQTSTKFYDKEQCYVDNKRPVNPAAVGILRYEITLKQDYLEKWSGNKQPKLGDITTDLVRSILEDGLRELGILDRSIGTYQTTLSKLCDKFGSCVGSRCYASLRAVCDSPTFDDAVVELNTTKRKLKSILKKIRKAGFVPAMVDAAEELPALVIDQAYAEEMEEMIKSGKNSQVILKDIDNLTISMPQPYHYSQN